MDESLNGYVDKLQQHFSHKIPSKPHHRSYKVHRKLYRGVSQDTIPLVKTKKLDKENANIIQQVIGECLYYDRSVHGTILPDPSANSSK